MGLCYRAWIIIILEFLKIKFRGNRMIRRKWTFLLLLVLLVHVITMSAQSAEQLKTFKTLYERELKENGVVGSSFVLLRDNKVVADYRYGSANLAKNQPVDENTIFHWASNTKPFTGIAIMQLRDRGLLKLDDPVTKYLPELRKIHNSYGSMDDITIRHLLTHSGGFRGGTWPWRNNTRIGRVSNQPNGRSLSRCSRLLRLSSNRGANSAIRTPGSSISVVLSSCYRTKLTKRTSTKTSFGPSKCTTAISTRRHHICSSTVRIRTTSRTENERRGSLTRTLVLQSQTVG